MFKCMFQMNHNQKNWEAVNKHMKFLHELFRNLAEF